MLMGLEGMNGSNIPGYELSSIRNRNRLFILMSNFISIKWDRFLTEGEAEHFPWLKEIQATDDLEEIQAGINFFSNRIVAIYNEDKESTPVNGENESALESDDSE